MKFCANLSFMFTERPFLERYKLAKEAGFKAVESGFPFNVPVKAVSDARKAAEIRQVLINIYTGDVTKGELGFAALPGKQQEFKRSLEETIMYAKSLGATKIHIMAGRVETPSAENHATYLENLEYAAGVLEREQITGLIEPINRYSVPGYYLNSFDRAVSVLESVNSPSLKLMLDVFHLQQIKGDVFHSIEALLPYVGHVQIAQVPNRNEPDTAGELNYPHILEALRRAGYNDWIGLEYKPESDSTQGLKWVKSFGYTL